MLNLDSSKFALSSVHHNSLAWTIGSSETDISAHIVDAFVEGLFRVNSAEATAQWARLILQHGSACGVLLGVLNLRECSSGVCCCAAVKLKEVHTSCSESRNFPNLKATNVKLSKPLTMK